MPVFEAGALIFRIQTVGQQIFQRDQREAKESFDKTGKAAADAGSKIDGSGDATDRAGKKAKDAKGALDGQANSTKKVGDESDQASSKQGRQAASTEQQVEAAKKLSAVLLVAGTAVGALVGLSIAKYAEFDHAMANTSAAVMATVEEQEQLGDAALKAGADTVYSASEAAAAEEELAKAGRSVSDIVGGSLNGALALAAAGQLQVARSAEIMATTLTQFRLPAEQAAKVSDILAAGAGKAQGSVDDLALALSYVGPLAGSVGLSLEETAGTIAYFATQGIIGEKAGTSLRGVLASLQAPSAVADKEMKKYSISMFDANGEMLSLSGIAEQLRTRLGGLSEQERLAALGRIFGNESLNAATLLYEGGAAAVEKWTSEVNDSGYAAEQAAKRQDNLAGDIEKLGGAFDTALIRTGSGANDVLREMVQAVTSLVDWYGEVPGPVQATALVLGVATAAMLLFAGGAVGARARFIELKAALDITNASMGRTALLGGAAGLALTGVIAVVALLAQKQAEARAKAEAYLDTLESGTAAVTQSTRELAKQNLTTRDSFLWMEYSSAYDSAKKLGISLDLVTDAATGNADALVELERQLEANGSGQAVLAGEVGNVRNAVKGEADSIEEAIEIAKQKQEADKTSVDTTKSAADAYLEAADNAEQLNNSLSDLIDTINEANGTGQDAISANIDYRDALAKVDEQIQKAREGQEGYSLGLDQTTQVGRDNLSMLNDLAGKAQEAADKQFALDGNTQSYRKSLEDSRNALIQRAQDLGYTADEAQTLADQIFRIPSETEWKMIAETSEAQTRIDAMKRAIDSIPSSKRVGVYVTGPNGQPISDRELMSQLGFGSANGNVIESYANGGFRSENHVAQMARAGAWRVWAEPETGGESYIPHAVSKRARSEAIMAETAAILGGVYIPSGATGFENGGRSVGSVPMAPAGSVTVTQYNTFAQTDERLQALAMGRELKRVMGAV